MPRLAARRSSAFCCGPCPAKTSWIRLLCRDLATASINTHWAFSREYRPVERMTYFPSSSLGRGYALQVNARLTPLEIT